MKKTGAAAYHHGDLRQALAVVSGAARAQTLQGAADLSLRAIGRELRPQPPCAGTQHFANKEALLAAVAIEGFRYFRHGCGALPRSRGS